MKLTIPNSEIGIILAQLIKSGLTFEAITKSDVTEITFLGGY